MKNTKGLGAGSYPEPIEKNYRMVKVECSFTAYVEVEVNEYDDLDELNQDIEEQVKRMSIDELLEEVDKVEIQEVIY